MTKDEYLRQVDWELRDLPWRRRKELVTDLRGHLDEAPVEQLEPPAKYAAELREAAGLGRCHGPVAFLRARRPRNVVLVVLLLVVVALLATAYSWVKSYQPVVTGSTGLDPYGSHSEAAGETVVTFHDGRPFRLAQHPERGAFRSESSASRWTGRFRSQRGCSCRDPWTTSATFPALSPRFGPSTSSLVRSGCWCCAARLRIAATGGAARGRAHRHAGSLQLPLANGDDLASSSTAR